MEIKSVKKHKVFSKWWFFLMLLFLIIVIPLTAGALWVKWALAAPQASGKEKIFVIKEAESTTSIANRLKEDGLIKDATAFRIYTRISCQGVSLANPASLFKSYPSEKCLSGNIQAGSFKLSASMSLPTLAMSLTKGRLDSWTKILEGWRNEEIAAVLAKNYSIKEADFLKIAKIGYMFPDTYLFKVNSSASEIVAKMQENFDKKFTVQLQAEAQTQGLTPREAVILASIVQRESGKDSDSAVIASVFLNRLKTGMVLGSDVTIQYALGYDRLDKTWWKKELTDQDLSLVSPYNTRKVGGLPPGPICNPGMASLKAVAEPQVSDYYYFLYGKDGNIHLGKTLQEHNQNQDKFL